METMQLVSLAVIIGIIAIYLIINIAKNGLRKTAINLILQAEKILGSGQGQEKMQWVINGLLANIGLKIPVNILQWFVQEIFDEVKELLEYTPESKKGSETNGN